VRGGIHPARQAGNHGKARPASAAPNSRARRIAPAEALRAPTSATAGRASSAASPSIVRIGGGVSVCPSKAG
jgi:hypothetical protein